MSKDVCEVTMIHEEDVQEVVSNMPDLTKVTAIFKALADDTRLKIIYALYIKQPLCVCDVAAVIKSSNATASHHLRYLKDQGLAKSIRKGKLIYYSLNDDHVNALVRIAYEHSKEVK